MDCIRTVYRLRGVSKWPAFRSSAWAMYRSSSARGFRVDCLCTVYGCIWTVRAIDGSVYMHVSIWTIQALFLDYIPRRSFYMDCIASLEVYVDLVWLHRGFMGCIWVTIDLYGLCAYYMQAAGCLQIQICVCTVDPKLQDRQNPRSPQTWRLCPV